MRVVVLELGAVGGAAGAAPHWAESGLIFVVCTFHVVTVPGITSILVVYFVLCTKGRPTGALEALVFNRDGSAVGVVTDEHARFLVWALATVVVNVQTADATTTRGGYIRSKVTVARALDDVTPAVDSV